MQSHKVKRHIVVYKDAILIALFQVLPYDDSKFLLVSKYIPIIPYFPKRYPPINGTSLPPYTCYPATVCSKGSTSSNAVVYFMFPNLRLPPPPLVWSFMVPVLVGQGFFFHQLKYLPPALLLCYRDIACFAITTYVYCLQRRGLLQRILISIVVVNRVSRYTQANLDFRKKIPLINAHICLPMVPLSITTSQIQHDCFYKAIYNKNNCITCCVIKNCLTAQNVIKLVVCVVCDIACDAN